MNGTPLSAPVVKTVMMFGWCMLAASRTSRWNRGTARQSQPLAHAPITTGRGNRRYARTQPL
jgi:hypothetical protein